MEKKMDTSVKGHKGTTISIHSSFLAAKGSSLACVGIKTKPLKAVLSTNVAKIPQRGDGK